MRTIWKGTISFGLVTIPVQLYSAVSKEKTQFRLLAEKDKQPVKYKRYSPTLGREVEWDEIVKGLEVAKGQYITFTKEELQGFKPEKSGAIDVREFVPADRIEPLYLDKPYYLAPQESGRKAYALLKKAMEESDRVAIAQFVMREKQYVCALTPYRNGMLLSTMHYEHEIRDIEGIAELQEEPQTDEKQLDLARDLIQRLSSDSVDLSEYKDTFVEQLKQALEEREEGLVTEEGPVAATREDQLMDALRASLEA